MQKYTKIKRASLQMELLIKHFQKLMRSEPYFLLLWQAIGFTNKSKITVSEYEYFFPFSRYFYNQSKCLFPIVLSGSRDL